jgi:SAM-dependent methyltransferase
VDDDYTAIASDYAWLASDEMLTGDYFIAHHRDIIAALPPDAMILDCACGIGADAISLARHGYRVHAADGSPALIAEAARRALAAGVTIPFTVCLWEELPHQYRERFDLVLCIGNSISHCADADAMNRALRAMHAMVNEGGLLVIDTRNWEKVRRDQTRLSVAERVVERDGARCIPLYLWEYPPEWDSPHRVEIVFLFEEQRRIIPRRAVLHYRPFRQEDLLSRLAAVGFTDIWTNYHDDADRYEIRARVRSADA